MKLSTKTIVTIGMFTAVLSVLSILSIPTPSGVPITLQTFAIALCGYVLGWKKGTFTTALYILIGTIGVPVFSGMRGGVSVLVGHTGGFIVGFLFLSFFCGIGINCKRKIVQILFGILGLAVCHLLGTIWFTVVTSGTISSSFWIASAPYLIKDIVSLVAALAIGRAISHSVYHK